MDASLREVALRHIENDPRPYVDKEALKRAALEETDAPSIYDRFLYHLPWCVERPARRGLGAPAVDRSTHARACSTPYPRVPAIATSQVCGQGRAPERVTRSRAATRVHFPATHALGGVGRRQRGGDRCARAPCRDRRRWRR